MCSDPCNWKRSSNGWFMKTELRIVYARSICNSRTASDRNHAHLIRLPSTMYTVKYRPDSRPPSLLLIGNRAWIRLKSKVAADITRIMKIAWTTYLGALSRLTAIILIPRMSAHPPILTQCKGAPPVALFREVTYFCWGGASVCTTLDKSEIGMRTSAPLVIAIAIFEGMIYCTKLCKLEIGVLQAVIVKRAYPVGVDRVASHPLH